MNNHWINTNISLISDYFRLYFDTPHLLTPTHTINLKFSQSLTSEYRILPSKNWFRLKIECRQDIVRRSAMDRNGFMYFSPYHRVQRNRPDYKYLKSFPPITIRRNFRVKIVPYEVWVRLVMHSLSKN